MPVVWQGIEWSQVLFAALLWSAAYYACKEVCGRSYSDHPKVVQQGGSYGTAFMNALVCSAAGLYAISSLYNADTEVLSLIEPPVYEPPFANAVAFAAVNSFFGWLLSDLVLLFVYYPNLGGGDMVLHHVLYIVLATLATGFRIAPFVAGWLLSGEVSSLFLNYRWLLINSGRGDSKALKRTEYAFAGAFFVFRVVFFWGGMLHVLTTELPFLLAPPQSAPFWAIALLCGFVVCGAVLNVFWFGKIVRMAVRASPAASHSGKTKSEVRSLNHSSLGSPQREGSIGDSASECSDMSVV